jgi:hypothetical protein
MAERAPRAEQSSTVEEAGVERVEGSSAARVVRVADIEPERVGWLWPARIPLGKLTLLDGDPGLGKSTLLLDLAARVSTGSALPDGARLDAPASVVILSAEDGIADTIRPRLEAAGADLDGVYVLADMSDDEGGRRPPEIPLDLLEVERVIRKRGARFVLVDPLLAFLSGDVDSHRDQDVRRALHGMAAVAERTGAAFLSVRHLTKTTGPRAVYRGGGSIGIIGAARAGLLVAEDPGDDARRVLAVIKSNLAAKPPALGLRLVTDHPLGVARVEWLGPVDYDADSLIGPRLDAHEHSAVDEAKDFLRAELADGPKLARQVIKDAHEAAIAEKTLRRAKSDLGVLSDREGGIAGKGRWLWALPKRANPIDASESGEAGPLSANGSVERSPGPVQADSPPKASSVDLGPLSASLPGDDSFREYLNTAFEAGVITDRERHERRLAHNAIVRARLAGEAA